jgi:hypothetical protein
VERINQVARRLPAIYETKARSDDTSSLGKPEFRLPQELAPGDYALVAPASKGLSLRRS